MISNYLKLHIQMYAFFKASKKTCHFEKQDWKDFQFLKAVYCCFALVLLVLLLCNATAFSVEYASAYAIAFIVACAVAYVVA